MSTYSYKTTNGIQPIDNVKNVLAIASGKGGVGKSTVAVNLAKSLTEKNPKLNIGILDADIYGPSIPSLLGVNDKKAIVTNDKKITPIVIDKIQFISIASLIANDSPAIWRGPMASGALQQLFFETTWTSLDYLIIDLPPGTGDIQLTLVQKLPITASIIVTTPQDIALLDVCKAVQMFNKLNIPILGIIENMSMHTCNNCGHIEHIFGKDGAEKIIEKYNLKLLGKVPLANNNLQEKYYPQISDNILKNISGFRKNLSINTKQVIINNER